MLCKVTEPLKSQMVTGIKVNSKMGSSMAKAFSNLKTLNMSTEAGS